MRNSQTTRRKKKKPTGSSEDPAQSKIKKKKNFLRSAHGRVTSFKLSIIPIHFYVPVCALSHFTRVRLRATPWTVAPPGSSVHGLLQARILGWVAISSSRGSSQHTEPISPAMHTDSLYREVPITIVPLKEKCISQQLSKITLDTFTPTTLRLEPTSFSLV